MDCRYCGYFWAPRKKAPVSCPRCKRRLDISPAKERDDPLSDALKVERGLHRTVFVMSPITAELEKKGIVVVVVGGAAVEFYTRDWYSTGNIDLAVGKGEAPEVGRVLEGWGFKREGRLWTRVDLDLYIEVPGDTRNVDMERIVKVRSDRGHTYFLGAEEMILDRLNAVEHWKSARDMEQALRIAVLNKDLIDWKWLEGRCGEEDCMKALKKLKERIKDEDRRS